MSFWKQLIAWCSGDDIKTQFEELLIKNESVTPEAPEAPVDIITEAPVEEVVKVSKTKKPAAKPAQNKKKTEKPAPAAKKSTKKKK